MTFLTLKRRIRKAKYMARFTIHGRHRFGTKCWCGKKKDEVKFTRGDREQVTCKKCRIVSEPWDVISKRKEP